MPADELLTIVHPGAEGVAPEVRPGPRLTALQGTVVGLVDNARHNSDRFMNQLESLLAESGVATVVMRRKANPSVPMEASLLDELVSQCDAVVHGVAD